MKLSRTLIATALVSLAAAGALYARQDPKEMEKMMAFMTPGEHHKVLEFKVGKWNCHITHSMAPGMPAAESDCTCETKWIMGGRYLHDNVKGTVMGMPFEGMGISGYDNLKQKYVFTWVDSMGTGISSGEGSWDAAKKTLTSTGQTPDPMSGKYVATRSVETQIDADNWKMESYGPGPDGKEFLSMTIQFKRAK
jgi:hypothetical protein